MVSTIEISIYAKILSTATPVGKYKKLLYKAMKIK